MPVLQDLLAALRARTIEVVDLTAPLHSGTPILQLPPPFANASPFGLTEISRYDERGPAWYWNNIQTSEHTGTHVDPPAHFIAGGATVDVLALDVLIGPAVVADVNAAGPVDRAALESLSLPDGTTRTGVGHDVEADGHLVVRCDDGTDFAVSAGDVVHVRH